jgi:hypothetical protein
MDLLQARRGGRDPAGLEPDLLEPDLLEPGLPVLVLVTQAEVQQGKVKADRDLTSSSCWLVLRLSH